MYKIVDVKVAAYFGGILHLSNIIYFLIERYMYATFAVPFFTRTLQTKKTQC